jgi:DNA-binding transcriptional MocR family regulator
MAKHAEILRPKFEAVLVSLDQELGGKGIAEWSQPTGGYFVNLNVMDGCARAVVDMAAEAGVKLTPAGSTFPYGQDPRDRNIRIAPSFPPVADIQTAMGVVGTCIELAAIDKLLGKA